MDEMWLYGGENCSMSDKTCQQRNGRRRRRGVCECEDASRHMVIWEMIGWLTWTGIPATWYDLIVMVVSTRAEVEDGLIDSSQARQDAECA